MDEENESHPACHPPNNEGAGVGRAMHALSVIPMSSKGAYRDVMNSSKSSSPLASASYCQIPPLP